MFEPLPEALSTDQSRWRFVAVRLLDRLRFCEVGGRNLAGAAIGACP